MTAGTTKTENKQPANSKWYRNAINISTALNKRGAGFQRCQQSGKADGIYAAIQTNK